MLFAKRGRPVEVTIQKKGNRQKYVAYMIQKERDGKEARVKINELLAAYQEKIDNGLHVCRLHGNHPLLRVALRNESTYGLDQHMIQHRARMLEEYFKNIPNAEKKKIAKFMTDFKIDAFAPKKDLLETLAIRREVWKRTRKQMRTVMPKDWRASLHLVLRTTFRHLFPAHDWKVLYEIAVDYYSTAVETKIKHWEDAFGYIDILSNLSSDTQIELLKTREKIQKTIRKLPQKKLLALFTVVKDHEVPYLLNSILLEMYNHNKKTNHPNPEKVLFNKQEYTVTVKKIGKRNDRKLVDSLTEQILWAIMQAALTGEERKKGFFSKLFRK